MLFLASPMAFVKFEPMALYLLIISYNTVVKWKSMSFRQVFVSQRGNQHVTWQRQPDEGQRGSNEV